MLGASLATNNYSIARGITSLCQVSLVAAHGFESNGTLINCGKEQHMSKWNNWLFWPDHVALSVLVLFLMATIFLYAARTPAHSVIHSLCNLGAHSLRYAGRWLLLTAASLRERNRTVLLAHGEEDVTAQIEREFERVENLIRKDLAEYPALQRKLMEALTRIENDYHKCGDIPPPPPEWVEAMSSMAKIKSGGEIASRLLEDMQKTIQKIHDKSVAEYRKSYESRHKILKEAMPQWRSVEKIAKDIDGKMITLNENVKSIDSHMSRYEEMRAKSDKIEHALTVSSFVQVGISALVMCIAAGGAFINFKLIALPMSEMVGASDYMTDNLRTSDVAALVIILMEASMGLFLLESLRITHLFPKMSSMNDRMRRRITWAALILLLILASIESSLALMRDMLVADKAALLHSLSEMPQQATNGWFQRIPMAGQMILGFILPFALAFVAIPLETLVYSLRNASGAVLVVLMRGISFALRFGSLIFKQLGRILTNVYDILIVLPLMVERIVVGMRGTVSGNDSKLQARRAS
jgi:hypothetical protein